ncbi:fungal specific transcription factor domain-containing protein [Apiospora kogelbergensis]|uniref:Fungal specific transcription factor domain-containing protein n=1 Tax=Apiospora kogelbergensis TaxID=1337665 RepID=A0AAW0R2M5_9PEZI
MSALLKCIQLSLPLVALALPTKEEAPSATAIHPIGPPLEEFKSYWADATVPEVTTMSSEDLLRQASTEQPPSPPKSAKRWINGGVDNRVQYNDQSYPYAAMGKLGFPGGYCSGSLIGPRHVAAARHCYVANQPYVFQPDYNDGDAFPSSSVSNILLGNQDGDSGGGDCFSQDDWAVFVLNDRLGDAHGYLGARVAQPSDAGQAKFLNFGYPGDLSGGNRPYRQTGVTATSVAGCSKNGPGPAHTDLDCSGGQSGSSLFVTESSGAWSYGVLSTAYVSGDVVVDSVFAGGVTWVNGIGYARSTWA